MRAGAALLAATLWAASAAAQPSIWDKAADPQATRTYHVLVEAERMIMRAELSSLDLGASRRNFTRAALAVIQLGGGESTRDPRLLYLLGDLLSESGVRRDEEARRVLRRALAADPDSPLAGRAWFNLAIASARLGDSAAEHGAYTQALSRVWESDFRANIYMNRGESSMVLGNLKDAIADYRRAIVLAQRPELTALAHYGLGIALERNGDLPSALTAMNVARSIKLPVVGSALDLPSVFFVPDYDLYYYKALSAMAAERSAKQPQQQIRHLIVAIGNFSTYLEGAEPDRHRWAQNARLHRDNCQKKLDQLLKDNPKLRPAAQDGRRAR
jgi:tetratricopeptide (TPR) repeat protein